MIRPWMAPLLVMVLAGPAVRAAPDRGPAFDCRRASGEVEKLICADAALTRLDRALDEVYRAAAAKARGALAAQLRAQLRTQLRAEQRGWVKGRNDCWKANSRTWITATWTVDSVRDCVDAQYRLRTSELQAVWRLVAPVTQAFACQGQAANEVVANFHATDPPTIRLERGDRTATLWRVAAAGAGAYEGQNVSLVHQAQSLKLSWLDTHNGKTEELQCQQR